MRSFQSTALLLLFAAVFAGAQEPKQPPKFDVRAHYTKYEYRIPMRDGARLFTAVYVPKDASHPYPFLFTRTPYSVAPYGEDHYPEHLGPSEDFENSGFIFVHQDARGRWMSEGKWREMTPHIDHPQSKTDVDESTDAYDTIEWLLKNVPNNNGRVGIWGISYLGFYTAASIIDSHPAIKAASPQAPVTDLYMDDDAYHGGAFMLAANFDFYAFFKPQEKVAPPPRDRIPVDFGTEDGYQFFLNMGPLSNADRLFFKGSNPLWNDQVAHTTYDSYWKQRSLPPHLHNIHCAVLTVGGWFDAEDLEGPLSVFRTVGKNNAGIYNGLVMGPWVHGGWDFFQGESLGHVHFDAKTSDYFHKEIELPFFEQYLKAENPSKLPTAYVFETGSNVWRRYEAWPPRNAQQRTLYFHGDGKLSFDPPSEGGTAFDEYVSDPNRPVPFVGYTAFDVPQEYMASDQRFASRRTDVLVYQTDPLEQDVTVVGPVSPRLRVSTSGTDTDFVVKLIDVYPPDFEESKAEHKRPPDVPPPNDTLSGFEQLVRGEPMRGKFRHSFEKPEPFTPGKIEEIDFTMPDVNHTFRRGHRIMVQVQSSWFPLVDRNPQTFVDIPNAKPSDFQKATERVYRSASLASGVVIMTLPQTGR
ncbi:MAG TPA: CocE/NonD family hydrolase [Terriglobales bacterium]|nr:CocE/NonD family hydrolase [Terriglobales bacterium]